MHSAQRVAGAVFTRHEVVHAAGRLALQRAAGTVVGRHQVQDVGQRDDLRHDQHRLFLPDDDFALREGERVAPGRPDRTDGEYAAPGGVTS